MSGIFPQSINPIDISISEVVPGFFNTTHSGRRNVRLLGSPVWEIKLSFDPNLTRDQMMPIWSFLLSQRGRSQTFTYILPIMSSPRGALGGNPKVAGALQSGTTLSTSGWTPNTVVLKAGDFFKLAANSKVYAITEDISSDATGAAMLKFEPPLVKSPGDLEALVIDNVPFTVYNKDDNVGLSLKKPALFKFSVSLVEDII